MKILLIFCLEILSATLLHAQNVGIGTNTPTYPLTVVASSNKGIVQKDGTVEVGFYSSSISAYLQTWSNHSLNFATNNASAQMTLATNGNFGIGTTTPTTKFYVNGASSLMGNVGINTSSPVTTLHVIGTSSLIGSVGINTTSPTADLDINGTLRLRSSSPATGAVLTSTDANGNTEWVRPLAFRATGGYNGVANTLSPSTWTKIYFNQTATYNLGLGYQPINSQFAAPVKGIYLINAQLEWDEFLANTYIRIRVNRGGSIFTLAQNNNDGASLNGTVLIQQSSVITCDLALESGDIIWVEANAFIPSASGTTTTINASSALTWFSGRLVNKY